MATYLALVPLLLSLPFAYGQVKGGYWFYDSGIAVSDIDSTLFTHLFCGFASLNPTTFQLTITSECATFTQTVRRRNPSVKTLLSIGGGSADSSAYNRMASQASSRKVFIDSAISLARANGFTGLDLDWEGQTTTSEMNNLAALLDQMRAAINTEGAGKQPLLFTAALGVTPQVNPATRFPTAAIARTLDWVNVMAYDIYAPDRNPSTTRAHALLRDPSGGVSGSSGITAWINSGVPARKLVLGFPYYGYAWKLVNPNNHGLLAPASGYDTSVGFPEGGIPNYIQIRQFISQRGAHVVYDSSYVTNYCYSGTTWIGYDDTQAISAKVSYAKSNGLLGYFAWHVAADQNWVLSRTASQTWGVTNSLDQVHYAKATMNSL